MRLLTRLLSCLGDAYRVLLEVACAEALASNVRPRFQSGVSDERIQSSHAIISHCIVSLRRRLPSHVISPGGIWRLNKLGLLRRLDCITSVSVGTVLAARLAARWKDRSSIELDFSRCATECAVRKLARNSHIE